MSLRVEGQIRHVPDRILRIRQLLHRLHALLDCVLMGARERRVNEVADIGMALADRHPVAEFDVPANLVDPREVELGIDPLGHQVQRQGDQIDIPGALTIAKQSALDPFGPGHQGQLRRGDRGAAVVVGMQADDHRVPARDVAAEPLDHVGVEVGRRQLNRGGKIEDQLALRRRLEDVHHRLADFQRVVRLGRGEALGRVLEADVLVGPLFGQLPAELRSLDSDFANAGAIQLEDDPPLGGRGRVVEVDDRPRQPVEALEGLGDQLLARLRQDHHRHVAGNQFLGREDSHELELRLCGGRKADLDLLEANAVHQHIEQASLAIRVHRRVQRLVAVSEVDARPDRRGGDTRIRPGPVRQLDPWVGRVLMEWHR